jgi:multidrug resistance efflux pump
LRSLQRELRGRFPPGGTPRAHGPDVVAPVRPTRRLPRGVVLALVACLVPATFALLRAWNSRLVADARLEARLEVLRAPAAVRVVEVRGAPGERVRAGDVLIVLASVAGEARRHAAEVAVRQAAARVAALEAGARLPDLDLGARVELALAARREALEARAELDVRTTEVETLRRERDRAEVELRLARADRAAGHASFEGRLREAAARLERARGASGLHALEVERLGGLAGDGLVSELALAERRAALEASLRTQDELSAALDARRLDQEAERAALARDEARDQARLAALDAAAASAVARRTAAAARAEELERLARERALLAPADADALVGLRARELELACLDLAAAQAELEAALEAGGGGDLRAAFDGEIEELRVAPGAVVAAGDALLSYHALDARVLVAYLPPEVARLLQDAQACTLVPEDGGAPLRARAGAAAPRLVPCPPELRPRDGPQVDLRVRLALEAAEPAELAARALDLRFQVVFDGRAGP